MSSHARSILPLASMGLSGTTVLPAGIAPRMTDVKAGAFDSAMTTGSSPVPIRPAALAAPRASDR